MSDNEEDMSNNDSILNSVKTEPSDLLNDSMEHHRNSFPATLLGISGNGPVFIWESLMAHASSDLFRPLFSILLCNQSSSTSLESFANLYKADVMIVVVDGDCRTDTRAIRDPRGESGSELR